MARVDEESALREALTSLTYGQPEMPADRLAGVRRRHVRRRAAQSIVVGAAGVAALAGVLVAHNPFATNVTPASRDLPSWALPWPDHRDGSVPQSVLDYAVNAWRYDGSGYDADLTPLPKPQPKQVIWYYGNKVPDTNEIAVVFEVEDSYGVKHLVAGTTVVDEVMPRDSSFNLKKGSSPWVLYDVKAPMPAQFHNGENKFVGLNLSGQGSDGQGNYHNVVVLLADPSLRSLHAGYGGDRSLDNGLAVWDAGAVDSQVEVSLRAADGSYPTGGFIGVPGAPASFVPQLTPAGALTGVPSVPPAKSFGEASAQGSEVEMDSDIHGTGRPTTIYARCMGARSIRVAIDTDAKIAGVTIPCDDAQHVVAGAPLRPLGAFPSNVSVESSGPGHGHYYYVHATPLTAWRVQVLVGRYPTSG